MKYIAACLLFLAILFSCGNSGKKCTGTTHGWADDKRQPGAGAEKLKD